MQFTSCLFQNTLGIDYRKLNAAVVWARSAWTLYIAAVLANAASRRIVASPL